jgi:hypothetical protein
MRHYLSAQMGRICWRNVSGSKQTRKRKLAKYLRKMAEVLALMEACGNCLRIWQFFCDEISGLAAVWRLAKVGISGVAMRRLAQITTGATMKIKQILDHNPSKV